MKVNWNQYFNTVVILALFLVESIIIIPLGIFINSFFFALYILTLLNFIMTCYYEQECPDFIHMNRKNEYLLDDSVSYGSYYIYVKFFPGVWVKTAQYAETIEKFINKKVEYQHKQKESFKV